MLELLAVIWVICIPIAYPIYNFYMPEMGKVKKTLHITFFSISIVGIALGKLIVESLKDKREKK